MKDCMLLVEEAGISFPLKRAEGAKERREGLLPFESAPSWGLLLARCPSVHSFGMSFAIDVVFVRRGKIVSLRPGFSPRRVCAALADTTIELPAGSIARLGLSKGQSVRVRDAAHAES